jgi:hypothetical protein
MVADVDPLRVLTAAQGFFTRAEARDVGYDDRAVIHCVRGGLWHRIRRGYFSFTDAWRLLAPTARHWVLSRAVVHSLGPDVALSHVSGVVAHSIAVWDMDLSRVNVTRLGKGTGRIEGDVVHHEGRCVGADVVEIDGVKVLVPERCVLEAGSRAGQERALVMLDNGLFLGKYDDDLLQSRFAAMGQWPYMRSMHVPVRMARAGAQSPGESRGRYFFWVHHIPAPQLQFKVHDSDGRLIGTTDWGWPDYDLFGEFDGKVKYGRLLEPGMDPGSVVFAEKQREDALREASGCRMLRLVWDDYDRPRVTLQRVLRMFGRRAG